MTPQQLRNSILQLAMEGKLVEQRPEEGTGEELYQLIQEEKQELIKAGKIKKTKEFSKITEDELPFATPKTWRWCKLSDLCMVLNGDRGKNYPAKATLSHSGIPFISALNIKNKTISRDENLLCMTSQQYDNLRSGKLEKGDIVFCIRGSIGKYGYYPFEKGAIASSLVILRAFSNCKAFIDYLMVYLETPLLLAEIKKYDNGTAQPNLSAKNLERFLIPLPPFEELKRIVEKVSNMLPMIHRYEKLWLRLNELNKRFPEDLQKSTLQEAIQGKLCEQKDEDGSAKALIEKISLEKERLIESGQIKKHKALPAIQEDKIPFDIPSSWCWERLGNISTYNQTKPKIKAIDLDRLIWVLDLDDIEKDTGKILRYVKAKDKKVSGEKVVFHKGQILYSKLRPYLKKALIAPEDGVCTPELVPFDIFGGCNRNYILSVLKSPYVDFGVNSATYGVKMPRVGVETMINLLIPIPPIREQERIVKKIDKSHSLIQRFKDLVFV
ncbi:restriction endonuclease subunit S [Veillonella parvula]